MPIAILRGKHFLIVTHGVSLYAHSFTWSENLCFIAVPGVKRNARSEAICSLLYME